MRRIIKKVIFFLVVLLGIWGSTRAQSYAASAALAFVPEEEQVEAGTEFTIILQITADTTIGDFEGYFTYDADLAEYTYGPSCITGGDGYLKISDIEASPSNLIRTYVMTFTALKHGVCQFAMNGVPVVYAYEDGNAMSVMSEPYSLRMTPPASASDNALLDALRVSPGSLTPTFDPAVTEYEVTVDATTERLIVSAIVQDTKASVSVEGNTELVPGENHVSISVTAENGDIRTYHILTIREESEAQASPEPTQTPQEEMGNGLRVTTDGDNTFFAGNYQYRLVDALSEVGLIVPEGYTPDYLLVDGATLTVYVHADWAEFCLIALTNEAGENGWYRFDRTEYTLQRYAPEVITVTTGTDSAQQINELLAKTSQYEKDRNKMSIVTGILGALIAMLAALCIRLYIRSRGYDDELD